MIQRIQSFYLGVAAVMMIVAAASLAGLGIETDPVLMAGTIVAGALAAVSLGSVFLYSNRVRQRKVVRAAISGCVLLVIVILFVLFAGGGLARVMEGDANGLITASIATLVGLVLMQLASRAIKKDIDLVKSMDRIR